MSISSAGASQESGVRASQESGSTAGVGAEPVNSDRRALRNEELGGEAFEEGVAAHPGLFPLSNRLAPRTTNPPEHPESSGLAGEED